MSAIVDRLERFRRTLIFASVDLDSIPLLAFRVSEVQEMKLELDGPSRQPNPASTLIGSEISICGFKGVVVRG